MEKVNDTIVDVTASPEQKMLTIKRFLKDRKTSALMGVNTSKGSGKPKDGENQSKPKFDPLGHRNSSFPVSPKHLCTKSHLCKPDWGLLGCCELYKLATADERCQYCQLSSCCYKCGTTVRPGEFKPSSGGNRKMKHICDWRNGNMTALYMRNQCWQK